MRALRMQSTVVKLWRAIPCSRTELRRMHASPRLLKLDISRQEVAPKTSFMPTRQGVIHIAEPSNLTFNQILPRLGEGFRPNEDVWKKHYHPLRHAIVILATPNLSSHLEEGSNFIPQLLQTINWPSASKKPYDVDVVCACVDGLPPSLECIPQSRGKLVDEGFAILYGETTDILPSYHREKLDKTDAKSEKPGSITFREVDADGMHVTLPLANTLFKNGRLSTLLVSRWQSAGNSYTQVEPQVSVNSVSLNALGSQRDGSPQLYIPAIPLTYARPLRNGYGNILRSLVFQGHEKVDFYPASSELEIKVPQFLKEALGKMSALKIWALIIPRHVALRVTKESSSSIRLPDKEFEEMHPIEDYKEVGYWISQGASLCRVQSGGGGWGPKAGLLSLDPEQTYSHIPETAIDMDDFFFEKNDDNKHPGINNIAKAGSYIQFFTARETRTQGELFARQSSDQPVKLATVIGTIPSSIDSMNQERSEAERIEEQKDQEKFDISKEETRLLHKKAVELLQVPFTGPGRPEAQVEGQATIPELPKSDNDVKPISPMKKGDMYVRRGEFGFVSESGMFINQGGAGKYHLNGTIETKIDIPYSFIYQTFGEDHKT